MRKFVGWMVLASGAVAGGAWACGSAVMACQGAECDMFMDAGFDSLPVVETSLPDATEEEAESEDSGDDGGTDAESDKKDAHTKLPLGHACKSDADCPNCVDGVCCSTASCPASDECHVAGKCSSATGRCSASPPAPSATACTASHSGTAACDGNGDCLASSCDNGFENDQGVCKTPGCVGVTCGGSDGAGGICTGSDGTCGSGQHCSDTGQCVCDSTSCSGCCDANGQCQTSAAATCGIGGVECKACTGGCCSVSGTCAQNLYPDMDQDTFGDMNATPVCGEPTSALVANNKDCCDKDSLAHPQPMPALPTDYPGLTTLEDGGVGPQMADKCGSYDYDCSGEAVELYANLCSTANFSCNSSCVLAASGACTVCPTNDSLPVAPCASGTGGRNGYDVSQPPCGGAAHFGTYACETLDTTCNGPLLEHDPIMVYQLCF